MKKYIIFGIFFVVFAISLCASDKSELQKLIGADPDGLHVNGNNITRHKRPLLLACEDINLQKVRALIQEGADLRIDDDRRWSPLLQVLNTLQTQGCVVTHEHTEIIKELLHYGVNVNIMDNCGFTALHYAAVDFDIFQLLLDAGADIHLQDNYGKNFLHFAIGNDFNIDLIKTVLLCQSVDINAQSNNGRALLHTAAEYNRYDVGELLLSVGADVNVRNLYKETPLHIAIDKNSTNMISLLLSKSNVNVNIKSSSGFYPLEFAVQKQNINIIQSLIDKGAQKSGYYWLPKYMGEGSYLRKNGDLVAILQKYNMLTDKICDDCEEDSF